MNVVFENKIIFNPSKFYKHKFAKAIFFDRDGVINEDYHYIKDPSKVKLCIGAKCLIRKIFQNKTPKKYGYWGV